MAAKFCCCLPLRLGVFIFTILQFLLTGAAAGLIWFALFTPEADDFWAQADNALRIGFIVSASIYTFTALIGLIGFFGAAFRKNALVKIFYGVLWLFSLLQVGSGIWVIVVYFRYRNMDIPADCDALDSDKSFKENFENANCGVIQNLKDTKPVAVIVPFAVAVVVTFYMLYVTHHYIKRIAEQRRETSYAGQISGHRSMPSYGPVSTKTEEAAPLTQPSVHYPYSDNANAFGHQKNTSTGYTPPVFPGKTTV